MSHLKCLIAPSKISRNLNCLISFSKKTYCSDKKVDANKTINKSLNRKEKPIKVNEAFADKKVSDVEGPGCEPDEEVCTVTERERDANVRSRLSKACNTLTNRKIPLTPSALNLCLDTNVPKKSGYDDYSARKPAKSLKQDDAVLATVSTEKPSPSPSLGRIIRQEPGKVLFAFVPEEWFTTFIPKTGVSGFPTFLFTFGTYLVSKEYYVLEHNYYGGLSMAILCWATVKYVGPHLRIYLDREIDSFESSWNRGRTMAKQNLEHQIENEHLLQFQADGQMLLMQAKRENVAMQLEEEFRKRQVYVYQEVKNRLDYHVKVEFVKSKIQHKNLVEYVNREVMKSITPEMQNQLINISLDSILLEFGKGDKK